MMQLLTKTVAVAFTILGRTMADELAGGFVQNCYDIALWFEDDGSLTVQADCTNTGSMGPPSICSYLNLNHCFGVASGGAIIAQENGNFQQTCNQCEGVQGREWIFTCNCQTGQPDNPTVSNTVNTNLVVSSVNGYLQCYSQVGDKCPNER